jgi:hypothetical protein
MYFAFPANLMRPCIAFNLSARLQPAAQFFRSGDASRPAVAP